MKYILAKLTDSHSDAPVSILMLRANGKRKMSRWEKTNGFDINDVHRERRGDSETVMRIRTSNDYDDGDYTRYMVLDF